MEVPGGFKAEVDGMRGSHCANWGAKEREERGFQGKVSAIGRPSGLIAVGAEGDKTACTINGFAALQEILKRGKGVKALTITIKSLKEKLERDCVKVGWSGSNGENCNSM